jgi:glycosyltransferase involved in cell wall biosynthesis
VNRAGPPSDSVTVAVAVVTYGDRAEFLSQGLKRIFTQTVANRIGQVVVCDNGAGKESKDLLADMLLREPRLHTVTLPYNTGSARGFAEAIRVAAASGCEYIWVLDDDNLTYPDALERLLNALEFVEPEAALLSLRRVRPLFVRRARGASIEDVFGQQYSFLGFSVLGLPRKVRQRLSPCNGEANWGEFSKRPVLVPWGPYGGFLFKAEQLSEVGLPEVDFYLYGDDYEFTLRFTKRGYHIYLVPDSQIEDVDKLWFRRRSNRSWGSGLLLMSGEENALMRQDALMRQFYSHRNRAFFEYHSLAWGGNALYGLNAISCLLLLFVEALLLRIRGQRLSWLSFIVILCATWEGWRGRLGRTWEGWRGLLGRVDEII